MGFMQKTAIIVPCYNEAGRLRTNEFLDFTKQHDDVSFIFVNDCSLDNTADLLKKLCLKNPKQILLINLPKNLGKSGAVREGFLRAFQRRYAMIGYWDADLAAPLRTIREFMRILESKDVSILIGSRVKLLHQKIQRKAYRHYLGRVFATIASLILDISVYDTQCGAKLFKNDICLQRVFSLPFKTTWAFDVEILARFILLNRLGGSAIEHTAIEYPLEEWRDIPGSKLKLKDFFKIFIELFEILWFMHSPGASRRYTDMLQLGIKEFPQR